MYYTALLVNVGCHSDAHEQAKWFGDDIKLKSPFTLGHSVAVADLAAEAAHRMGLPREEVQTLRRAGLVHGFGRLGVSNSIWDRPGPLSTGEWEHVRQYPYLTERMLHQ